MTVKIGVLWDSEIDHDDPPFGNSVLERSYRAFSQIARSKDAEVFIARYDAYDEAALSRAYSWNGKKWVLEKQVSLDVVFDKFMFAEETVGLKSEIGEKLPVLNLFELEEICKDKLLTYQYFPEYVPETFLAERKKVEESLREDGKVILKPRYGSEGAEVRLIESMDEFESKDDLLAQRYIEPSGKTPHLDFDGAHDFRIVLVEGEPELCYYRLNDRSVLANVSMGGSREFIDVDELPDEVNKVVEEVSDELSSYEPAVYSIDFVFDESMRPWIVELSSKPGLAFDDDESRERKMPLIEKTVEVLINRAQS